MYWTLFLSVSSLYNSKQLSVQTFSLSLSLSLSLYLFVILYWIWYSLCLAIHAYGNLQIASGDGLHISTLLTVRSCTIMYCTYMYVFSVNKILFKPNQSTCPDRKVCGEGVGIKTNFKCIYPGPHHCSLNHQIYKHLGRVEYFQLLCESSGKPAKNIADKLDCSKCL